MGSLWARPRPPHSALHSLGLRGAGGGQALGNGGQRSLSSEAGAGQDFRTPRRLPGGGSYVGQSLDSQTGGRTLARGICDFTSPLQRCPHRAPFRGVASQFLSAHKDEKAASLRGKPVFPLTPFRSSKGNSLSLHGPDEETSSHGPGHMLAWSPHHTSQEAREGAEACHPAS